MSLGKYSQLFLRLGLAFVFGLFGIDKIVHWPLHILWLGWIPNWLTFVPQNVFLIALGIVEIIVALLLLVNRFVRLAALACAAFLAGVVFSFGINEYAVRDIGLIAMALALALMPEPRRYHDVHEFMKKIKK